MYGGDFIKKFIFYIPAIIFTILFGWMTNRLGMGSMSPIIFIWFCMFLVSGFLLNIDKFWGGILGMLPGINFIYMSRKYTGQYIDIELLLGIIILLYYILSSSYVYRKDIGERSK